MADTLYEGVTAVIGVPNTLVGQVTVMVISGILFIVIFLMIYSFLTKR